MGKVKTDKPSRHLLWFSTCLMTIFTMFMFLFFDQRGWEVRDIIAESIFILILFSLIVTIINPTKYWWGLRIITFIIFCAYLSYLSHEMLYSGKKISLGFEPGATPINSVVGFLIFGLPCLIYTFWGSVWGRVSKVEPENATKADLAVLYIALFSQFLAIVLMVVIVLIGIYKWIS